MKWMVWISLCLLLSLPACSAPARGPAAVVPAQSGLTLEEWAALYPTEYNDWKDSVHGVAYLAGNPDAPGCTDCHPDPQSGQIQTAAYRLEIPSWCARCHADENMMVKYDLASDVYATYRADYHGTTIEYYRANSPTALRFEAVCSDCHGSHATYKKDDPRSSVASANLLATCQQCHKAASPNFALAATGHLRTTPQASLFVYLVKLFYLILIPVVIGVMLVYIGLDIAHRVRNRSRRSES